MRTKLIGVVLMMAAFGCGEAPEQVPCADGGMDGHDAGRDDGGMDEPDGGSPETDGGSASTDGGTPPDAGEPVDPPQPISPLCEGAATAPFQPPTSCDALSGATTTSRPDNGVYSTSWFGCYRDGSGRLVTDPYDNCQFACGSKGLCDASLSGPECQAQLRWFAAGADRFGCGKRVLVTNCANGRAIVLAVLDRGPNCRTVEKPYGAPVMDMSYPAMVHLFDGNSYGGRDYQRVVVEPVADDAVLGPVR